MRRAFGAGVVAALMAVSSVAFAGVKESASYKDVFPDITYSGSAGSIPWGYSPWQEIGDDGSEDSGLVHVYTGGCYDYKCLNIEGYEDVGTRGAVRYADLSMFSDAEVCFDVVAELEEEGLSRGVLSVQVTDGSQNWKTLGSYALEDLNWSPGHGQFSIDGFIGEGSGIRFVVTGTLFGEVYIDNVEIKGSIAGTTTSTSSTSTSTTSTTKPKTTTTTSEHQDTTTTTGRETTTTVQRSTVNTTSESTTTTVAEATTSTVAAVVPVGPVGPPPDSGLRDTDRGLQANYSQDLFGAMDMGQTEVVGVEFDADYSMAVEVFSATWIWMVALLLIIATAIVSGLDRRRPDGGAAAA